MSERAPPALVAVVDDDPLVRESIRMLLASHGFATRGHACCREYLDDRGREDVDCLILDVRLPGIAGPELQERLNAEAWCPPIVFVSGHGTVPLAVKAMRLGALDFLQKPFDEAVLLDRVAQGVALSAERRHKRIRDSALAIRRDLLSARERDVLEGLVAGLGNKQIADRLGISTRTAEQHRASLKRKLGARSLADLLRVAMSSDGAID